MPDSTPMLTPVPPSLQERNTDKELVKSLKAVNIPVKTNTGQIIPAAYDLTRLTFCSGHVPFYLPIVRPGSLNSSEVIKGILSPNLLELVPDMTYDQLMARCEWSERCSVYLPQT